MSRALQLILAEHSLQAGGADSQGAGAEHEGTTLGHEVHGTLQGQRPGLSGTLGCKAQGPGPQKVQITIGQVRGGVMGVLWFLRHFLACFPLCAGA